MDMPELEEYAYRIQSYSTSRESWLLDPFVKSPSEMKCSQKMDARSTT